jgi:hypothetical protein
MHSLTETGGFTIGGLNVPDGGDPMVAIDIENLSQELGNRTTKHEDLLGGITNSGTTITFGRNCSFANPVLFAGVITTIQQVKIGNSLSDGSGSGPVPCTGIASSAGVSCTDLTVTSGGIFCTGNYLGLGGMSISGSSSVSGNITVGGTAQIIGDTTTLGVINQHGIKYRTQVTANVATLTVTPALNDIVYTPNHTTNQIITLNDSGAVDGMVIRFVNPRFDRVYIRRPDTTPIVDFIANTVGAGSAPAYVDICRLSGVWTLISNNLN